MQDVPAWPATRGVSAPLATVTVNTHNRAIIDYSVRASVGTSDVSARTGSITWAPPRDVHQAQDTVLTTGTPRRGDRISIDAGDGDAQARILTGRVDTTASNVPGPLVSELIDDWDMLDVEVDVPALTATMHPDVDEGPLREVGLTATWPTQRALSQAGFRATPDGWPGGSVTASLNGSLWPETGEIMASTTMPSFVPAPWGDGARGYSVTYRPGARGFQHGDLQISFLVGTTPSTAQSLLTATFGSDSIQVVVRETGIVQARIWVGGAVTLVASLTAAQMAGTEHVVLRVSSAGVWRLVAGNGQSVTATHSIPSSMIRIPDSWTVYVSENSPVIGGVNFGFASTPGIPTFTRTAVLSPATGTLSASRAIVSTPVRDVLRERAQAEQARMWIDARGVFQWRSYTAWGTGNPVRTITDVDLLGYRLGMDYDSVYSGAIVSHLGPIVDVRSYSTITLYQGNRQVLNAGDRETTVITVPEDEDWPAVDWSMDVLALTGNTPAFNRGKRSWTGATWVIGDGDEKWGSGPGEPATFTFEVLDARTWVHTVTVASWMGASESIEIRAVDHESMIDPTGLWKQWAGYALPVVRGYARVTWLDRKTYGATSTTVILPRLEHDCSWWVQGGAVQRLADYLAQKYAAPVMTIKGLEIVPDQRIEIGDVLTLTDRTYAGLTARVVVTGIDLSGSHGHASMSLDVEVQSATATRKTYADVQAQAGSRTYAQFQALIGAVTYQQHEEAP